MRSFLTRITCARCSGQSDLAVLYPWEAARLGTPSIVTLIALLVGISVVVFVLRRRRYLVTGWLWYLIMLGPVIGILQVGNQARADRYTYLPQIGLYLLVTWAAAGTLRGLALSPRAPRQSLQRDPRRSNLLRARSRPPIGRIAKHSGPTHLPALLTTSLPKETWARLATTRERRAKRWCIFKIHCESNPGRRPIHSSLGVFFLEMGRDR